MQIDGAAFFFIAQGAHHQGVGGLFVICRIAAAAAQQGAQPGLQLVQVKRFGQVVVGPRVQAQHAVAHGAARGQQQHGGAQAAGACLLQYLQAVQAGQGEVQHHGVGRARAPFGQRGAPVRKGGDGHAAARQRALQRGLHGGVVFDEKQLHPRIRTRLRRVAVGAQISVLTLVPWTAV